MNKTVIPSKKGKNGIGGCGRVMDRQLSRQLNLPNTRRQSDFDPALQSRICPLDLRRNEHSRRTVRLETGSGNQRSFARADGKTVVESECVLKASFTFLCGV